MNSIALIQSLLNDSLLLCDQESYRLPTLDYGQRWLVLNPFPNSKHQVIKFHTLQKLCDLIHITIFFVCIYWLYLLYYTMRWLAEAFIETVFNLEFVFYQL